MNQRAEHIFLISFWITDSALFISLVCSVSSASSLAVLPCVFLCCGPNRSSSCVTDCWLVRSQVLQTDWWRAAGTNWLLQNTFSAPLDLLCHFNHSLFSLSSKTRLHFVRFEFHCYFLHLKIKFIHLKSNILCDYLLLNLQLILKLEDALQN